MYQGEDCSAGSAWSSETSMRAQPSTQMGKEAALLLYTEHLGFKVSAL